MSQVYRRRHSVFAAFAVSGLVLLGLLLRLHALSAHSLWLDEGASVWISEKSIGDMLVWLVKVENHPPLYYALLHFWTKIDDSVSWIRLLSVIPSVLTVPLIYGLGCRLYSPSVGLLSALLLAISPFDVLHAQDARMYSLLGFTATSATYCLVWGIQSARTTAWLCYALAVAGVAYSQTMGLTVIMVHAVILVTALLNGERAGVSGIRALAAGLVVWLPWIPITLGHMSRGVVAWISNPSPRDLSSLFLSFTSDRLPERIDLLWLTVPLADSEALIVSVSLGLVCLGIGSLGESRSRLMVALLVAGPVVLELAAGIIQPVFLERTLIPVAVVYILALAAGLLWLMKRTRRCLLGLVAFTVLVLLNLAGLHNYYNDQVKERWDRAASYVAGHGYPGDIIIFQGNSSQLAFDYYYSRIARTPLPEQGVPCTLDHCYRYEGLTQREDQERIADRVRDYRRIWLVKRWWANWDFTIADAVGARYAERLRLREEVDLGGVVVMLYEAAGGVEVGNQ